MRNRVLLSAAVLLVATTAAAWYYVHTAWRELETLCAAMPQGLPGDTDSDESGIPAFVELSKAYMALDEDAILICDRKSIDDLDAAEHTALAVSGQALDAPLTEVRRAIRAESTQTANEANLAAAMSRYGYSTAGALSLDYYDACARGDEVAAIDAVRDYFDFLGLLAARDDLDNVVHVEFATEKLFEMLARVRPFQAGHTAGMEALQNWSQDYDVQGHVQRSMAVTQMEIQQEFCRYRSDTATPLNVRWFAVALRGSLDCWPLRIIDMRNTLQAIARDAARPTVCADEELARDWTGIRHFYSPMCASWNDYMSKMGEIVCRSEARRLALFGQ